MSNVPVSISVISEYFDAESGEKYDELSSHAIGVLQKKDETFLLENVMRYFKRKTDFTIRLIFLVYNRTKNIAVKNTRCVFNVDLLVYM